MSARRRRSETSSESDRIKRRGRPRVDKPDASPSDRRRTQIRVAQRAYRQRKEGTLDGLRKRVSDLTNTIEMMNDIFGDCRNRLLNAGILNDQMRDLCDVAGQFDALVREIRSPGDDCRTATYSNMLASSVSQLTIDCLASSTSAPMTDRDLTALETESIHQSAAPPQAAEAASWLDQSALVHSNKWHGNHICTAPLGYEVKNDAIMFGPQAMPTHDDPIPPLPGTNDLEVIPTAFPNGALTSIFQPKPLATYNFQESTFARRIFRAVVETAYDALANPAKRPSDYERIFRLVLSQEGRLNRAEVLAVLGKMLSKGHYEELNNWNAPLLHPGGAGTHYAPRDAYGNLQPKRTTAQLDSLGTDQSVLLDGVAHRKRSTESVIRVPGFEGEWLDPYDVQGYLEEKCIFIDSSASFVEAEITEQTETNASGFNDSLNRMPGTTTGSLDSRVRSTPLDHGQLALLKRLNADLH